MRIPLPAGRKQQFILFVTLAAAVMTLIAGTRVGQAAGIVLLGGAVAWLVGRLRLPASWPRLNRRHKVGVLLLLVAVGIALLAGASAEDTVTLVLLGAVGAWLLGHFSAPSLLLTSSAVALVAGVLLAAVPLVTDYRAYEEQPRDYDNAIAALGSAIEKSPAQPGGQDDVERWPPYPGTVLKAEGPPWKLAALSAQDVGFPPKVAASWTEDPFTKWIQRAGIGGLTPAPPGLGLPMSVASAYGYVGGRRVIGIPSAARRWERTPLPASDTLYEAESYTTAYMVIFPELSDHDIMEVLEEQLLTPRPSFSAWGSLEDSGSGLFGPPLVLLALFGIWWSSRLKRVGRRTPSPAGVGQAVPEVVAANASPPPRAAAGVGDPPSSSLERQLLRAMPRVSLEAQRRRQNLAPLSPGVTNSAPPNVVDGKSLHLSDDSEPAGAPRRIATALAWLQRPFGVGRPAAVSSATDETRLGEPQRGNSGEAARANGQKVGQGASERPSAWPQLGIFFGGAILTALLIEHTISPSDDATYLTTKMLLYLAAAAVGATRTFRDRWLTARQSVIVAGFLYVGALVVFILARVGVPVR